MGLDVYLYRYENQSESKKKEKKYEEFSHSLWGDRKYESFTEIEKGEIRTKEKAFADSLGLDEYGDDKTLKECIEINSHKYPDHYFKIGYFRSSYNSGGINRILSDLGLDDLYHIFDHTREDEYVFQPDWHKALKNVRKVIKQLKAKPNYRCEQFSWNQFINPNECTVTDTKSAMAAFLDELKREYDGGYSNSKGLFHLKEPLKIYGVLNGTNKTFFTDQIMPCAYLIYEGENEWYTQALEIVEETINYVLSKEDKDKYYLHWSS